MQHSIIPRLGLGELAKRMVSTLRTYETVPVVGEHRDQAVWGCLPLGPLPLETKCYPEYHCAAGRA